MDSRRAYVASTSFVALFTIVGLALYGLPFYYDFMVRDFGWTRAQVTSGNAVSKLLIGFATWWPAVIGLLLVAVLQAYVFAILTCLYLADALHLH